MRRPTLPYSRRLGVLRLVTVAVGVVLVGRLYHIQFAQGDELRIRAAANRFVPRDIEADRGVVYDSAGRQVVLNKPRFTVSVVTAALPSEASELRRVLGVVADALDVPVDRPVAGFTSRPPLNDSQLELAASTQADVRSLMERLPKSASGSLVRTWLETPIARNVPRERAFRLMEESWRVPGVIVAEAPVREYPAGPTLAHLLGFTGSIPPDELTDYREQGYAIYDIVGRSGIEATYEEWLKGGKGEKLTEIDATGRELRVVGETREPEPGHSLVLTLDLEFQRAVEDILATALREVGSKSGAVVVLDPRDGAVRALVSLPTFDNNLFSVGASAEEFAGILLDSNRPLLNRATSGQYPPGSIFKMITAAAALQEGVVSPDTRIFDPGVIVLPNQYNPEITYPFYCWLRSGHGSLNMVGALAHSCDVYFYEVAGGYHEQGANQPGLGSERLGRYARMFGLGQPTGIELLGEAPGRVPSSAWLEDARDLVWTTGETYNMGIGQSYLLVTPLQMAVVTSAVANDGWVHAPHLVAQVQAPGGRQVAWREDTPQRLDIAPAILATVREGMRGVVTFGTAQSAWSGIPQEIAVAGKTGTAEFADVVITPAGPLPRYDKDGYLLTHAWFVAFAPYENPEIAIAVFIDGSGLDRVIEGSQVAAPIAGDVLRAYFGLAKPEPPTPGCPDCPPDGAPDADGAPPAGDSPAGEDAAPAGNSAP